MAMRPGDAGVGATAGGEPIPIEEAYTINVVPSELFLKFRKELQNLRVGINLEVSLSLSLMKLLQQGREVYLMLFCYCYCPFFYFYSSLIMK